MPYIIVARQPRSTARSAKGMALTNFQKRATTDYDVVSERAVVTLEEARVATKRQISEACLDDRHAENPNAFHGRNVDAYEAAEGEAASLPETGGTIGPLPDGTVIEVEPAPWDHLASLANVLLTTEDREHLTPLRRDSILDAYNNPTEANVTPDERHAFELPGGSEEVERLIASYATALAEHLGYGSAERWLGHTRFVLDEHQCAQLLYELTNDKRYLEEPS